MYDTQEIRDSLDNTLQEICDSEKIPGMALIVSQNGEREFEKMYGFRDKERKLPVTADTLFGVASITKSVVALAIMQLEDEGKLSVDDPVVHWLSEFKLPQSTYTERITIHHLLTHTSGLPGLPAVHQARAESIMNDPDGEYLFGDIPRGNRPVKTVIDVMEAMEKMDFSLLGAPGEVFNYSNEGYALLQEIIERASGKSFIPYVDAHILEPLGMNRSVFLTEDLIEKENVTELYAYTKDKERQVFHSPVWWDVGDIYSNGSMKASVSDLMTYLDVYLLDGFANGNRIVSEKSIEKMTTPYITLPNGNQYGYGLQVQKKEGNRFVGHGGSIKGVSSNIQLAKDNGLAVCVLANIAEVDAEGLASTAMNQLLEIETDEVLPEYPMAIADLKNFTGHYQTLEGQEVHIASHEDRLYIEQDSGDIALRPCAMNEFVMQSGKKLVFTVDNDQHVTGIFRGMRWLPKT